MLRKDRLLPGPAVCFVLLFFVLAMSVCILRAPDNVRVQFVPDDGFYYLVLAKNFSRIGTWTFDSGISRASGYHPFFSYWLTGFYNLFNPGLRDFLSFGLLSTIALSTFTFLLLFVHLLRKNDGDLFVAAALVLSSKNIFLNFISVTEWPLVVMISMLYYFFAGGQGQKNFNTIKLSVILFVLACFGSLARADFGLVPISFVLAALLIPWFEHPRPSVRPLLAGVSGAVLGILLMFANNLAFTGSALQSSSRIKLHWAGVIGFSPVPFIKQVVQLIVGVIDIFLDGKPGSWIINLYYSTNRFHIPLTVILVVFVSWLSWRRGWFVRLKNAVFEREPNDTMILLSGLISLACYTVFYTFNSQSVQHWYTSTVIVAVVVVTGWIISVLRSKIPEPGLAILVILLLTVNLLDVAAFKPQAEDQRFLMSAAGYLNENYPGARVAAWNAGVLGYYTEGRVINLDGLVNNDLGEYIRSGRLPCYLADKKIEYVFDFKQMFNDIHSRRGGYDRLLIESLQPEYTIPESMVQSGKWHSLTLYKVDHESLEAQYHCRQRVDE